ncbi:hypothetical protein ATY30_26155 [Sinorhizobium americanum]|nr:hypothetical protein CO664_21745 [Sinorhizobium sp. NG07B]POH26034.1 hypothetical protein ATY30_26155 [Sinorhizobium americanum]
MRSILATAVLGLIAILGGWAHDEAARAADQRALCLCEYSRTEQKRNLTIAIRRQRRRLRFLAALAFP